MPSLKEQRKIEEEIIEQFMLLAKKLEKKHKVEIIYNVDEILFLR